MDVVARRPRFEVILKELLDQETVAQTHARLAEHGLALSVRQVERDIPAVKRLLRDAFS